MTKRELRTKYKILRQTLNQDTIDQLSRECFTILFENFDFETKNVGIFLPMENKNEPNTFLLFSEFLNKKINYFAPKIDTLSDQMNFYSISNIQQLEYGLYQIPEPIPLKKIEFSELEFILVPLLCFDSNGNRVGYGKGYYDKLLANASKNILTIGISLFNEQEQIDDLDSNDIALDYCIIPQQLIKFRGEEKSR